MTTMTTKRDRDAARKRALAALQVAAQDDAPKGASREAAEAIVELRRCHEFEGRPDWAGKSPEYRLAIEVLYRQAGITSDSKGSVQANLRYHVGNVVRQTAPLDDLLALGMTPDGPAERSRKYRDQVRRAEGKPQRSRNGGVAASAPVSVSVTSLLEHAAADLRLARQLADTGDVDDVAVLTQAREVLDLALGVVQVLA